MSNSKDIHRRVEQKVGDMSMLNCILASSPDRHEKRLVIFEIPNVCVVCLCCVVLCCVVLCSVDCLFVCFFVCWMIRLFVCVYVRSFAGGGDWQKHVDLLETRILV